jgi:hypothetical protein
MLIDKICITIYLFCVLAWISILPMIQIGMGAGKSNHDWWREFTSAAMAIVAAIFVATGFCHAMYYLWFYY